MSYRYACSSAFASVAVFAALLLGGCASSAPQPDAAVAEAGLRRVAVVEARGLAAEDSNWKEASGLDSMVVASLRHFDISGTRLSEAVRADLPPLLQPKGEEVWAIDRQAVREVGQATNTPYVLLVRGAGFSRGTGEKVARTAAVAAASVLLGALGGGLMGGIMGPGEHVIAEMALLEAETGETVWEGGRAAALETEEDRSAEVVTRAVLLEMLTGRALTARSLMLDDSEGDYVTVYPHEGPRLHGTLMGFDGLNFTLEKDDGERFSAPVEDVNKVKATQRNRFIFPVQ